MVSRWALPGRRVALLAAGLLFLGAPAALAASDPQPGITVPPLPGVAAPTQAAAAGGGTALTGTFRVTAGSCSNGVSGSWFRMTSPAGSAVSNSDSTCSDQTYTPLSAGSDGGLVTGAYQADPAPAFDGTGNGLAHRIFQPTKFYGVEFAVATDPTDPQTGTAVTAPSISTSGGSLNGDLRAFTVSWNNQHFNQGAPKPDGSSPGKTSGPTGTYNAATGTYKLTWSSQIVGGPFNNFTGTWQLVGTFVPASPAASTAPASGTPSSGPGANSTQSSGVTSAPSSTAATDSSSASTNTASGSLPMTGGGTPLLPAAALLGGGLVVRRIARTTKTRKARA